MASSETAAKKSAVIKSEKRPNLIRMAAPPEKVMRRGVGVRVGDAEIRVLHQLVEYDGLEETAKAMEISKQTLLMVMSGLLPRCTARVQRSVREFFCGKPTSE